MQTHHLAKVFLGKIVRFGQIWLDFGEILANKGEIWVKLRRNFGKSN